LKLQGAAWGFSNPALVAVTEAEKIFPKRKIRIVSVGAGQKTVYGFDSIPAAIKTLWTKEKKVFAVAAIGIVAILVAIPVLWKGEKKGYGLVGLGLVAIWSVFKTFVQRIPGLLVLHNNFTTETDEVHKKLGRDATMDHKLFHKMYLRFDQPESDRVAAPDHDWTDRNIEKITDHAKK
jgi:hypothetical protein